MGAVEALVVPPTDPFCVARSTCSSERQSPLIHSASALS